MELKAYYAETSNGPYLELNEDNVLVDSPNNLFAVLDGFGGVGVGDKASQLVAESLKNLYMRVGSDPDATLPFYYSEQSLLEGNALINACYYAHRELINHFVDADLSSRGGVSVVASVVSENILVSISVGNCIGLLVRNGKIVQIINPDILDGIYDSKDKYFRTIPLNALGLYSDFKFSMNEIKIREGDLVVFMSDGCYSRLERSDLKSLLFNSELMLDEIGEGLMKRANELGNLDNQSVILLQF